MFWTITRRVIVSVVAFFVGWTAFVIVRPTQELRTAKSGESQVLAITLKRQGCAERNCPVYEATFRGDGTATYVGYANDDFIGTYTGYFSPREFAFLVDQLRRQNFFEMPGVSPAGPVDETMVLEVLTKEGTRVLTTHNWDSTPAELHALQELIDYQTFVVEWDEVQK
jgi:hypothetical protein